MRLTSLAQLTHLDLGHANGAMALAQQLPNLHSLALQIPSSHLVVSAAQRHYCQTRLPFAWLLLCW